MNGPTPRKPNNYFIKLIGVRRQEREQTEEPMQEGGGKGLTVHFDALCVWDTCLTRFTSLHNTAVSCVRWKEYEDMIDDNCGQQKGAWLVSLGICP